MKPSIIVHGGAGEWEPELIGPGREGVYRAAQAGWIVLAGGGSALDAVEAAIVIMEDDDTFDAGRGSFLNADGQVELDAGFMDGKDLRVGAVAGVQFIQNPIRLARAVLEKSDHVLLVAAGAQRFAAKMGFRPCELTDLAVPREFERWQKHLREGAGSGHRRRRKVGDTVGCVAMDQDGHVAAGTSTGGTANKMPGRVGDVPMVGCGFYADDRLGGASSTGWGEAIAKVLLARLVLDRLEQSGDPHEAARAAIHELQDRVAGDGGIILLSPEGHPGWWRNTPCMPFAYQTVGMSEPLVDV